jgi:serine/threonine protein kinase
MSNILGRTLLNQYRVDAFIASGGMGAVYRVWDLKRNVPLAMKVLHTDLADDPHMFKRFKREANALKKLSHPNIVPFYGLFQTMDMAFLLERYIDGPSLKDILRGQTGKPLSTPDVLVYLKALSSALGYAHANGVVHCDVKPGNVLIDQGGNVYLTDFGIARHAESTTTTMAGAGTAAYMAPEQIRGEAVTPATDVYTLGVMLFEMLTGQRPFRGSEAGTEKGGDTANERIRYAHLHIQPPDPRGLKPSISKALAQAILKALDKKPARRYPSAQDFLEAIFGAAGATFTQVTERIKLPQEFQETASPSQPILSRQTVLPGLPNSAQQKMLAWLAAGIALFLIAIIAFSPMNNSNHPAPTMSVETEFISSVSSPQPLFTVTTTATRTKVPTATSSVPLTPTESSSSQFARISKEVAEVNLRRSPGYVNKNDNKDVIVKIPQGATIEIIGGPTDQDGLTWWNVSWNGYEGWIADHTGSGRTIMIFGE